MPITEKTVLGRLNCDVNAAGELEIAHYTARSLFTRQDGSTVLVDQPLMVLGPDNADAFWAAWKEMERVVKRNVDELRQRALEDTAAATRAAVEKEST